ncbi:MAG: nitroreductase family protein [Bacteroidaceae bacterium]|nr:nitroreductase family protein [Bacteroidaceae bacterium]
MKAIKIYFSVALLLFAVVRASAQPRISIFFDHVSEIARQEKITVKDAAERVRQLGVDGIDVRVSMGEAQMKMLDSLGFQHASAIADIDFIKGEQPEQKRQALDFMRRYGYSRLLVIPGLPAENASPAVMDDVCKRLQAFVEEAAKEGIDVMVEDYDNPRSPCYNTQTLDRLFAASPGLNHVFDTGNYLFCGEDVMNALHHFRQRIHHVHLKDRRALSDRASLPIGAGIVPLKAVVGELLGSSYDGWFCIEHFGAPDMLEYTRQSVANIKAAWSPTFDEVLSSRRSIRSYDASKKISEAEVRELMKAVQEAPSWANQQPTKYYVAITPEKLAAVREMVGANKDRIMGAPVLIVSTYVRGKSGFFRGQQTNEVGDGWGAHDNGLSDAYLVLKARAMGFDTLIMGMREADKLRELFSIPEDETVMAVIALGYRAAEPRQPMHKDLDEMVEFF